MSIKAPYISSYSFKKGHLLYLFFVSFIFIAQLNAQIVPKISVLTTSEGLGFRQVNHIAQDENGLMWISTQKGLERYDGFEFITFNDSKYASKKSQLNKLKKTEANFINNDILLILANDKLFTLDQCNNEITEFLLPLKFHGSITNFHLSKNKTLYISVVNDNQQHFVSYRNNTFNLLNTIKVDKYSKNAVREDSKGNIWLSNIAHGLMKFNSEDKFLHQINLDSFIWLEYKFYFNEFFIDTVENDFYIFPKSKNEIWLFDEKTNEHVPILTNLNSPVYHAEKDAQGNIWFNTRTQIWKYNKKDVSNPFQDYTALIQNALQYTTIGHIYIDKTNLLWISTNNGIIKIPLSKQLFENILFLKDSEWGNEMRGIVQTNDGIVYAFCENGKAGLYKIDKSKNKIDLLYPVGFNPTPISGISHLCYDKNKNMIWCLNNKLVYIDVKTDQITTTPLDLNEFTTTVYHYPISLLSDGSVIFGFNCKAIGIFNSGKNELQKFALDLADAETYTIEFYIEDKDGNIWIGTNKGIFLVSRSGKIIKQFNEKTSPSLSNLNCLSAFIDSKDRLWLGTFGGGLNLLQRDAKGNYKNTIIDNKSGLCDDNITSIVEDANQNIWVSTYNGVSRIDNTLGIIQNFFAEDGLTHNEFNYTSSLLDNQGNIWFGGLNGITIIDPNKALNKEFNPPLVLTSFSSYNRRNNETFHLFNNQINQQKFIISPFTSWFQFNWSLPNYFNSEKNKYYIWLEGLESSWSYHGNNPYIRYNNLPHGDYVLKVKATDSKGNPSDGELAIPFTVKPFFYQTWWFNALWILSIAGIFYALYKYNLNKKLAMERMRTQIASDLHDEVGSMLSGLAMQSELLQAGNDDGNNSRFKNIADLSRSVVGKMRDLVWSIDSRSDTTQDLIDKMMEKLATMLGPLDISYKVELGDISMGKHLSVNVRQQLFLIFNEALTNIVRHSNASGVIVNIGNTGSNFVMSIKDNGSIADKTKQSTGMGMANIKMRAKKINANCEFITDHGFEVKVVMKKV